MFLNNLISRFDKHAGHEDLQLFDIVILPIITILAILALDHRSLQRRFIAVKIMIPWAEVYFDPGA